MNYRCCQIDNNTSKKNLQKHNPVEGVIIEFRRKWYCVMVIKSVPDKLWECGYIWVVETMPLTPGS